jgi:hypothetical protein
LENTEENIEKIEKYGRKAIQIVKRYEIYERKVE